MDGRKEGRMVIGRDKGKERDGFEGMEEEGGGKRWRP